MPKQNRCGNGEVKTSCDADVKEVMHKYSHKKCTCRNRRIPTTIVSGKKLNDYLTSHHFYNTEITPLLFPPRKRFHICSRTSPLDNHIQVFLY